MSVRSKSEGGPVRTLVEGDFLRLHTSSGQGYVLLPVRGSSRRRRVYVGPYHTPDGRNVSPAALEVAGELLREAQDGAVLPASGGGRASGREVARALQAQAKGATVGELALAYLSHVERPRAKGRTQVPHTRTMVRLLTEFCGTLPAQEFGPNRLRGFRDRLARLQDDDGRSHFTRRSVNEHVERVRKMIGWAVGRELLPEARLGAIKAVEALSAGDVPDLRESEPRRAVRPEDVAVVLPYLSAQLRAVVELLALTGARPSEVLELRPCDVDLEARVAVPARHKNAWRDEGKRRKDHGRTLALSEEAIRVLEPWVQGRLPTSPCFSPAEAEQERRAALSRARATPINQGNAPGSNRSLEPQRAPGAVYRVDSLRRAIERACIAHARVLADQTNDCFDARCRQFARERVGGRRSTVSRADLLAACESVGVEVWTPYQLRHLAVTVAEQQLDEVHASALAGHKDETVTRRYHQAKQREERARAASEAVAKALGPILLSEVG